MTNHKQSMLDTKIIFDNGEARRFMDETRHLIRPADHSQIMAWLKENGYEIKPMVVKYHLHGNKKPSGIVYAQKIVPEVYAAYVEIMNRRIETIRKIPPTIQTPATPPIK